MTKLRDLLAANLNQKTNAKTIVFAIKMFGYSARVFFDFVEYPSEISIPIDSRLIKIFERYKNNEHETINEFYITISKKTKIPLLHLDGIIRNLYSKLMQ
jgi:DNA-(apurinic or apyrimidinic site) lyase